MLDFVDLIENSIEQTATEVEAARETLVSASRRRNRYRKTFVLIVITVITALIVIGVIIHELTR